MSWSLSSAVREAGDISMETFRALSVVSGEVLSFLVFFFLNILKRLPPRFLLVPPLVLVWGLLVKEMTAGVVEMPSKSTRGGREGREGERRGK